LKLKPLLLIFILTSSPLLSRQPSPEISLKITKFEKTGDGEFTLEYSAEYRGPDPAIFKNNQVYLPRDQIIIEGIADKSKIYEKNFLYSESKLDLNGNDKFDDIYPVTTENRDIYIRGIKVYPLLPGAGTKKIFTPLKPDNTINTNKITESGRVFTLYFYKKETGEIKIGLGPENADFPFPGKPNSQVMIEIIPDTENDTPATTIEGIETYSGITNEKISYFQGIYYRPRITGFLHLPLKQGSTSGTFTLKGSDVKSLVRITLFFSISGRICIFDSKAVLTE
jgi:hypothetical protein